MHTIICETSKQQVILCGILRYFLVTKNNVSVATVIKMPIAQMSKLNVSNSGKKSDGCKLVSEIIFDDINIIGPLMNVHATILLATKSTSVSYFVAMTKAPGATEKKRQNREIGEEKNFDEKC